MGGTLCGDTASLLGPLAPSINLTSNSLPSLLGPPAPIHKSHLKFFTLITSAKTLLQMGSHPEVQGDLLSGPPFTLLGAPSLCPWSSPAAAPAEAAAPGCSTEALANPVSEFPRSPSRDMSERPLGQLRSEDGSAGPMRPPLPQPHAAPPSCSIWLLSPPQTPQSEEEPQPQPTPGSLSNKAGAKCCLLCFS